MGASTPDERSSIPAIVLRPASLDSVEHARLRSARDAPDQQARRREEEGLADHVRTHGYFGVRPVLDALAKYPSAEVAAATLARLTHADFTSQIPDGRTKQRELMRALRAIGKQHPEVGAALSRAEERNATSDAALPARGDDPLQQVEKLRAAWAAGLDDRARAKWGNAVHALHVALFGKWSPYPAWAWRDLSPAQRALKELNYDAPLGRRPEKNESLGRRIRRLPAGPADVEITLDRPRPLFCAVNDVAAQLREPGPVLEAFRALPAAHALEAWNELAHGVHGVDVDVAKEWKFAGDGVMRPFNVAFRQRFVELLAEMSVALGERGERAAEDLARDAMGRDLASSRRRALAAYALTRHAEARGEALAAKWNRLLGVPFSWSTNPGIEALLRQKLGEARIAALPKVRM